MGGRVMVWVVCAVVWVWGAVVFGREVGMGAARGPNFVFMITDDQRFDALGVVQREQGAGGRFPFFQTPNMDRLAEGGLRFRNAFVVHSLCSPSRATFLTGRYSHQHGIRANNRAFESTETWAGALAGAGYTTGYFGKWHMGKQFERPGFTKTFTFLDQGDYDNCVMYEDGTRVESTGWVDDVITEEAVKFIEARAAEGATGAGGEGRGFAMVIGFKTPHDPRKPPARYADLYSEVVIEPPANAGAIPPFRKPEEVKKWNPKSVDRLNYFRCLKGVDDNVGRVLDALERTKLAEDTVVVLVGDNGYYLGEHGLGDKRSAYEDSIRIPFLMRYPRKIAAGTVSDGLVLNADLAPTFLALAGVAPLKEMAGRDLTPLFGGEVPKDWRRSFLYQNFKDPEYPAVTFDIFAVRTETGKLVVYPDNEGWTQVFDLRGDPLEMRNLAKDPAAEGLREMLWAEFWRQVKETGLDVSGTWLEGKR